MMSDLRLVYVTCPSLEDAKVIGRAVVTEGLAACANCLAQVTSLYVWNGGLQEDQEAILILKTTITNGPRLQARIRELHPYQVPCIVEIPITGGYPDFLQWVRAQTINGTAPSS